VIERSKRRFTAKFLRKAQIGILTSPFQSPTLTWPFQIPRPFQMHCRRANWIGNSSRPQRQATWSPQMIITNLARNPHLTRNRAVRLRHMVQRGLADNEARPCHPLEVTQTNYRPVGNRCFPSGEACCPPLRHTTAQAIEYRPPSSFIRVGNLCPPIGEAQMGRPLHQERTHETGRVLRTLHLKMSQTTESQDCTA
jgi:hypothetical protein